MCLIMVKFQKNMLLKRLLRLLNKCYLTLLDILLNNFHIVSLLSSQTIQWSRQSITIPYYRKLNLELKLLSKMSHNFYPATWQWICKDNITRAGIDFSIPFTVIFLPFHRWGEMKRREVTTPTQCYRTQWQTKYWNADLLSSGPVLYHPSTNCLPCHIEI